MAKASKAASEGILAGEKLLAEQYGCGTVKFSGNEDSFYERNLAFNRIVSPAAASKRDKFEALAGAVRDVLAQRWQKTLETHERTNAKQVYYLSMEFLIGRSLVNNVINLGLADFAREAMRTKDVDWQDIAECEPDAGLGNGGLGRLAACFVDSLATLEIPAIGYGLRYEYGIFRQELQSGFQREQPDHWLYQPDPWEIARKAETVSVGLNTAFELRGGEAVGIPGHPMTLLGIPHDRPIVGYGGKTINTLRLWSAGSPDFFDFGEFSGGDFVGAVFDKVVAESLTRVLYPDDSTERGRSLRFVQEYFLVACSLNDIVARFLRRGNEWKALPDKVAIQLNDTHPAMAVAELMRILLDTAHLGWEEAWDLTVRTLAYTNHTLLPEALEKWPVDQFYRMAPRLLEIIFEVNRRFLEKVALQYPGDNQRLSRMSLVEESPMRQIRMANLAVVGSHSVNGVAALHSKLLRTRVMSDFAEMFPDRFNNKTNGVTPRRWLALCNPGLRNLLNQAVGPQWTKDLSLLRKLSAQAGDSSLQEAFRKVKFDAKVNFADWLKRTTGQTADPDTIFDSQIKRIHEYKRQLLNALHIVILYNRLRENPKLDIEPRTFFFAGKAAPAYALAKLIIKFINSVSEALEREPATRGILRVIFVPNYSVSVAERLIPASEVSEQISTAGYEASGTSNMKFMMNGALTVGTRDGATIEIAEEAGEENVFLFGLTSEQVLASRGTYSPQYHYDNDPEIRAALDLIRTNHFNPEQPGLFQQLWDVLMTHGDYYLHLADLRSYLEIQEQVGRTYRDTAAWNSKAIINVAHSGKFSSDRTISEYASEIWDVRPCPI